MLPCCSNPQIYGWDERGGSKEIHRQEKLEVRVDIQRSRCVTPKKDGNGIAEAGQRQPEGGPLAPMMKDVFKNLQAVYETKKNPGAAATGFRDLDLLTQGGVLPGELAVVAGYASSGKSSLVMNICLNMSIGEASQKTLFFQKNIPINAIMERLLASQARVDSGRLGCGYMIDTDWPRLQRSATDLYKSPMQIYGPHMKMYPQSITDVVDEVCEYLRDNDPPALIAVDSLQDFCSSESYSNETRHPAYTHAAHQLKKLALTYNVPVIVTSWTNSAADKRYNKRPSLQDLVGVAGNTADIADKIMFIHRESLFCEHCQAKDGSCTAYHERDAEIIVAKNSSGPTGSVMLNFIGEHFRFENQLHE